MRIAIPHTLKGAFALVTLLLAGAAVGRVLGLRFGEALYLAVLLLTLLGWLGGQLRLRRAGQPET
ncbi:hypothetical protein FBR02_12120 [Anaerolineae bacterium CFX9]|nr:hypothetical protein [Anaerolineae bacterium CFX9]